MKRSAVGSLMALTLFTSLALPTPRAEAATLAELQAQIQALLAQLQGQMTSTTPSNQSCTAFTTDLTIGRSGGEVPALQRFLISQGHAIPAGATGYFGGQTQSALAQFQAKHGISPAVGYFGPLTRAKVNALCTTPAPAPAPTPTPGDTLSGEAAFEDYDAQDGEDTSLEEGRKNVSIVDVSFEVEDGDARINRVDVGFTPHSNNDEKRPWKVFSEVAIYHGDDRIAKIDASNRSNWKENNPSSGSYMIRLSGIDLIAEEGEEMELTIKVTTSNSINGADDGEGWDVFVPDNGIRAMDASKAVVYTGDTNDIVTIDIDRSGSDDELKVKRSDADPEATTLQLKDDARSGYLTIFAFDLDTDDSSNDIEIRKLPIEVTVSSSTLTTFMRDARLVVDGKTYTKKAVVDGGTGTITFEFNRNELVIDHGDRVTAELQIEFKALPASFEGITITASVKTAGIVAEGADDLAGSQLSGTATGETHTLHTKGVMVSAKDLTSTVTSVDGSTNDYATYSVTVKVTAVGQDVFIPVAAADAITYQLEGAAGSALSDTGVALLTSTARQSGNYYRIAEGETKEVTIDVTYQPGVAMTTARLQLLTIEFAATASTPTQTWYAAPSSAYETPLKYIVN